MYSLDSIILSLYNITPSKVRFYSIFLEGFLIETEQNKILRWSLMESAQLFNEKNKVTFVNSKDISKFKHYVYITKENLEEFLSFFGQCTFKTLKAFSKFDIQPKTSFKFLNLFLILHYLMLPVMGIVILFKMLFKDNKEDLMFNYYHTINISEELYDKILKNHYPMGFYLEDRKNIISKVIDNNKEINGPWLDLGCGLNSLLLEVEEDKGAEIYLLDPNPLAEKAYEKYKNKSKNTKIKFVSGSGEKLPFEDNYFSFIYCGGVIAHVCYLDKFLSECKRVLRPGGILLFDESNECPRKNFISTWFSIKLKEKINSNHKISDNYAFNPPQDYISNPWSYWGCSTDHFWIFNLKGLSKYLSKFFNIRHKGGVGSYLCNNGNCESFPLFYSLNLGKFTNLYLDFNNMPKGYLKLISNIFGDTGIYIYTLCEKE